MLYKRIEVTALTPYNIENRNRLMARIHAGEVLPEEDRLWLQRNPFYSSRYGAPYIIADMIPVKPGEDIAVTVQCLQDDPDSPIVPTFTIPFEKNGFVKLANVAHSNQDFRKMKLSTKLSMRMIKGITATLRCRSDSGLLTVSYQGWVPDNKPMPMWSESTQCPRFAMKKTVHSENLIQYDCCGADMTAESIEDEGRFERFSFLVNWYEI